MGFFISFFGVKETIDLINRTIINTNKLKLKTFPKRV